MQEQLYKAKRRSNSFAEKLEERASRPIHKRHKPAASLAYGMPLANSFAKREGVASPTNSSQKVHDSMSPVSQDDQNNNLIKEKSLGYTKHNILPRTIRSKNDI